MFRVTPQNNLGYTVCLPHGWNPAASQDLFEILSEGGGWHGSDYKLYRCMMSLEYLYNYCKQIFIYLFFNLSGKHEEPFETQGHFFSLPVSFSASSWHFALSCRRKPRKIMWDMVESTCIFKNKADKILESCSANWRNCLATFFLICLEHRDFVNSATPGQCWLSPGDNVTYI